MLTSYLHVEIFITYHYPIFKIPRHLSIIKKMDSFIYSRNQNKMGNENTPKGASVLNQQEWNNMLFPLG